MSNRCSSITNTGLRCRLHCVGNLKTCHVHASECSICLNKNGCSSHTLPCGHVFHGQCIGTWYANNRRCPMCRHYDKPKIVRIFYEVGLEPIEHSVLRPVLKYLIEEEVLQTEYIGVLLNGELIQRNGELIGYLWEDPHQV
jgi:hypothetical protein